MKIEMDDNTGWVVIAVAVCAVVAIIALLIFRYNALAYQEGYTQEQVPGMPSTIWVKKNGQAK